MLIAEAIGLGLVASLFFVEAVGFAAGGFVVPGYIALFLDSPLRLLGTVIAATATYLCMRLASMFLIIYGRRSLVLAVLLGFVFGALTPSCRIGTGAIRAPSRRSASSSPGFSRTG
jgi:poly-gamma-glutamate biosynthesis protein PgsC/CapC